MKTLKLLGLIAVASFALCQQHAFAATKTYQVTGKVLEINDKMIVVQKGDERWELARESSTKLTGVVKVALKPAAGWLARYRKTDIITDGPHRRAF